MLARVLPGRVLELTKNIPGLNRPEVSKLLLTALDYGLHKIILFYTDYH